MRTAVIAALLLVLAAPARADAVDQRFRDAARALADRNECFVNAWGTLRLDGTRQRFRFATLLPKTPMGKGAYVLELAPRAYWMISFYVDGRTDAFGGGPGIPQDDVRWAAESGDKLWHVQGHHHGGESLDIGLRGRELVVLAHTYTDDVTDPDGRVVRDTFPRAKAPRLAEFSTEEMRIAVSGPARSIDQLAK